MEIKTTDEARDLFSKSGLKYSDITGKKLQRLRNIINQKMKESGLFKKTYRCKQHPVFRPDSNYFWAAIRCKSFYFDDREVVSFNPDGFIGFAGWSSSENVRPILSGFAQWVEEMKKRDTN